MKAIIALLVFVVAVPAFGQCLARPSIVNEVTVAGTTPTCGYPSYRCSAGETITLRIEHQTPPPVCVAYFWRKNKGEWVKTLAPELVVETAPFYDHNEQHRWEAYAENTSTGSRSDVAVAFYELRRATCAAQEPVTAVSIQFSGARSGCTETNGKSCYRTEIITFTALPAAPYVVQPCDRFTWTFLDGTGALKWAVSVAHQYSADGVYAVSVQMLDGSSTRVTGSVTVVVNGDGHAPPPTGAGRKKRRSVRP